MRRFVVPAPLLSGDHGDWCLLPEAVVRHAVHVLRLGVGATVELCDGAGRARLASLALRDELWGATLCGAVVSVERPDIRPVWLVPALLKATRFEWLLEKAAELNVTGIAPFLADRAVVRWRAEKADAKLSRWTRILNEATRQCGAAFAPSLLSPAPLRARLEGLSAEGTDVLFAHLEASTGPLPLLEAGAVALVTGPEGGFAEREVQLLQGAGARGVYLGANILRAETAPIALAAAVRLSEVGLAQPPATEGESGHGV